MVKDQDVHPGGARQIHGFNVLRTAVGHDQRVETVGDDAPHVRRMQAIAFGTAVGNVIDRFGRAALLRQFKRDHRGRDAVHIVISVDENPFPGHRFQPQFPRRRGRAPQKKLVQLPAKIRDVQQLPELFLVRRAAVQHRGGQLRTFQPAGEVAGLLAGLVNIQIIERTHRDQRKQSFLNKAAGEPSGGVFLIYSDVPFSIKVISS